MICRIPSQLSEFVYCERCDLYKTRRHIVFGKGNLPCDILMVGEAPGKVEDLRGDPLVGPESRLLWSTLTKVLREEKLEEITYFITNMVCCRPKALESMKEENRKPEVEEMSGCRKRLLTLFHLAKPKMVLLIGSVAGTHARIGAERATFRIYNPGYVVRNKAAYPEFIASIRDAIRLLREIKHV